MWIRIENTYGNDTRNMREHLKKNKKEFGPISKLGSRRFETLYTAFEPSLDELKQLTDILVTNSKSIYIII